MNLKEVEPGSFKDTCDSTGYTLLMQIAKSPNYLIRESAIENLRRLYPVDFRKTIPTIDTQCTNEDHLGYTALHLAVKYRFHALWRFLVFHGADFTIFSNDEFPLQASYLFVNQDVLQTEFESVCKEQDLALCPLVHCIAEIKGKIDVDEFKLFVSVFHKDKFLDVNRTSKIHFKNALAMAICTKQPDIFDTVLNIPQLTLDFQVPVIGCIQTCFVKKEYMKFVSGGGFEVFLQTQMNVLTYAASIENYHAVKALFDAGVDVTGVFYATDLHHGPSLIPQLVFNAQKGGRSREDAVEMIQYVLEKNNDYDPGWTDPFLRTYTVDSKTLTRIDMVAVQMSAVRVCVDANDPELLAILLRRVKNVENVGDIADDVVFKMSVFNSILRNTVVGMEDSETFDRYKKCLDLLQQSSNYQ